MLCQRASLCPAETQEDKHQQSTKRWPWGRSYLQSWIAPTVPANASLRSRFMPWVASERSHPSSYPEHQGFMTQLLATRLKHNTKAVFTSARFTGWSLEQRTLPRLAGLFSLTHSTCTCTEVERLTEMCWWGLYCLCPAAKPGYGGPQESRERERNKELQEEKLFYIKSYPFHAFQIALQQRVQSEDHIVAEALEL